MTKVDVDKHLRRQDCLSWGLLSHPQTALQCWVIQRDGKMQSYMNVGFWLSFWAFSPESGCPGTASICFAHSNKDATSLTNRKTVEGVASVAWWKLKFEKCMGFLQIGQELWGNALILAVFSIFFHPWSIRLGKQLFVGTLTATMIIWYENTAQNRDYQGKSIEIESRLVVAWGWEKGLVANRP